MQAYQRLRLVSISAENVIDRCNIFMGHGTHNTSVSSEEEMVCFFVVKSKSYKVHTQQQQTAAEIEDLASPDSLGTEFYTIVTVSSVAAARLSELV